MMAVQYDMSLLNRLPSVKGKLTANASMAGFSWFRVGGPAEVLFEPQDRDDLAAFMAGLPDDVPVTVIGVASNLLVRDGGVDGVVIRLGKAFAEVTVDGQEITAGAGAMDVNVARAARDEGLAGFEFLIGIPGSIGGALRMNAGADSSCIFSHCFACESSLFALPPTGVSNDSRISLGFTARRISSSTC